VKKHKFGVSANKIRVNTQHFWGLKKQTFLGRKKQTKLGLVFFSEKNKKANIFGVSLSRLDQSRKQT
jgi:hypothetical protein